MSDGAKRAGVAPAEAFLRKGFEAWERAASEAARNMVADPRTLELGAAALKAHLLWRRSFNEAFAATWAPLAGLATAGKARS